MRVRVQAVARVGDSAFSNAVTFRTVADVPPAPKAEAVSGNGFAKVSWVSAKGYVLLSDYALNSF